MKSFNGLVLVNNVQNYTTGRLLDKCHSYYTGIFVVCNFRCVGRMSWPQREGLPRAYFDIIPHRDGWCGCSPRLWCLPGRTNLSPTWYSHLVDFYLLACKRNSWRRKLSRFPIEKCNKLEVPLVLSLHISTI